MGKEREGPERGREGKGGKKEEKISLLLQWFRKLLIKLLMSEACSDFSFIIICCINSDSREKKRQKNEKKEKKRSRKSI